MVCCVVLTRPALQNAPLIQRLTGAAIKVMAAPALTIEPMHASADTVAVPLPDNFDLVVFVSGNAVQHYLQHCLACPDWRGWPARVAGAAMGEATVQTLRKHVAFGAQPVVYAPPPHASTHDSEALLACLRATHARRQRVLIVRGQTGRAWLSEQLTAEGSAVQACTVYQRQPAQWSPRIWDGLAHWREASVFPVWVYTSSQGLAVVAAHMAARGWSEWWLRCPAVVTHPRLAQVWTGLFGTTSAKHANMVKICQPTTDALFEAIVSLCRIDRDRNRIQSSL